MSLRLPGRLTAWQIEGLWLYATNARPKDPYRTTTAVHSRSASIPISRLRCTSSPVYWLGRHFHCHLPDVSLQGVFEAAFRPCERPVPRPTRIQHISYTRMQSSLSPLVPKTAHSSHQGSGKHSRRRSLETINCRKVLGLRYSHCLPDARHVQALPSPARATYESFRSHFLGADRGGVRKNNDSTFEARAAHFATWLGTQGYDDVSVTSITPGQVVPLLAAYLFTVTEGEKLASKDGPHRTDSRRLPRRRPCLA
jgi:hypothetical protein